MKQILKKGLSEPWYIKNCPNCGCKFKYFKTDIEYDILGNKLVSCPQCKLIIKHSSSDSIEKDSSSGNISIAII